MGQRDALRLPVLSEGAEYLVIGYLMRRNILAYKAPPNNEGYDIICIHPNPKKVTRQIRVQVKSRYASDSNRAVPVKSKTFGAFDYLIVVFQNIGYYYRKRPVRDGLAPPEFFTLPASFVKKHHSRRGVGWEVFKTKDLDISPFRDETGFEQIARDLNIAYPKKKAGA
jgi:hypothetical protein